MPEMKDSGIEWIGKIPNSWSVSKLKYHLRRNEIRNPGGVQVLSVYREYGVIPKDSRDDNHNVTSDDTTKYKYVKPGVLVINKMKAWQGSMGVSEHEGIVSPAYFIFEFTDKRLYPKYLHYLLRNTYRDEFRRISGGIREGQWDLPADGFLNEFVPIPSIIEQKKIVEYLDYKCLEIETLIADIQSEIDILEEYKKSVISEAVTKGLDIDVNMVATGHDFIKFIPETWKFVKAGYLFTEDVRPAKGDEQPLSLSQKDGLVKTEEMVEHSMKSKSYNGWKNVRKNDLVLNRFKAHLGVFFCSSYDGMVSFHYGVYAPKTALNVKFYEYLFHSKQYCDMFAELSNGITVGLQNLSNANFYAAKCAYPPLEEQNRIVDYLENKCAVIGEAISTKKEQLATLEEYKKSIIYEYVTGKKEVPAV